MTPFFKSLLSQNFSRCTDGMRNGFSRYPKNSSIDICSPLYSKFKHRRSIATNLNQEDLEASNRSQEPKNLGVIFIFRHSSNNLRAYSEINHLRVGYRKGNSLVAHQLFVTLLR
ncbi:hypothetical protein ACOSQ3_007829 [Xanthoceras sorbifolium]